MAKLEAPSDAGLEGTEVLPDALPDRLQRLKSGRPLGRVDADALGGGVVDGDEDGLLPGTLG